MFLNENDYDYLNDKEYSKFNPDEIDKVLKKKDKEELMSKVFNLNETIRIAVILIDVLQFSYEKSSDLLDIPEDVLALRLFYGRKKLAEELIKS